MRKYSPSLYCKCGSPISDDRAKVLSPYKDAMCEVCERCVRHALGDSYEDILRELNEKIES